MIAAIAGALSGCESLVQYCTSTLIDYSCPGGLRLDIRLVLCVRGYITGYWLRFNVPLECLTQNRSFLRQANATKAHIHQPK